MPLGLGKSEFVLKIGLGLRTGEGKGRNLSMAQFIKSASQLSECPFHHGVEIAVVGRSNAGKSTLINSLLGHRLARTSSSPGHTRLLNFFLDPKTEIVWVDLPGYGFSATSKSEAASWQGMIEPYLLGREPLKALLLVMDARRDWDEEEDLRIWLKTHRELPLYVALTKVDKLNRKERNERISYFRGIQGLAGLQLVSGRTGEGVRELKDIFEKLR